MFYLSKIVVVMFLWNLFPKIFWILQENKMGSFKDREIIIIFFRRKINVIDIMKLIQQFFG